MPREEYFFGLSPDEVQAVRDAMSIAAMCATTIDAQQLYHRLEELFTIK